MAFRNRKNRPAIGGSWLLLAGSLVALLYETSLPVAAQTSDSPSRPLAINARVTGSAAGGTQQQNSVNLNLSAGNRSADDTKRGADATRARFEFAYGNGKKPGQDRITTTEMFYGEVVESIAITNGPVQKDAQGNVERGHAPLWLQGVASTYHHIAFGLDHERSFGIGLNYVAQSGFSVSADIRHVSQSFAARRNVTILEVQDRQVEAAGRRGLTDGDIDPFDCQEEDPQIRILQGSFFHYNPGWPDGEYDNQNNHSLITRIDYGSFSFLFTGDLEVAGIELLIDYYSETPAGRRLLNADVLQVGHHGSHNATTHELVNAVTPSVAVIPAGNWRFGQGGNRFSTNGYGHPRKSVVDLL